VLNTRHLNFKRNRISGFARVAGQLESTRSVRRTFGTQTGTHQLGFTGQTGSSQQVNKSTISTTSFAPWHFLDPFCVSRNCLRRRKLHQFVELVSPIKSSIIPHDRYSLLALTNFGTGSSLRRMFGDMSSRNPLLDLQRMKR
jgi:hypothetical protein